jgi:replicative DNA helicase
MEEKDKIQQIGTARKRLRNERGTLDGGKVQPQAIPMEEAVLGALMLDKDALPVILDILRSESFYLEANQLIYKAMLELFQDAQPIDLLTVTERLKKNGELDLMGGPYRLVELTNQVSSAANIEFHARIIAQKFIQRELIRVSTKIIQDAYEDTTDVFTLLDDAEKGLFSITEQNLSRGVEKMGSVLTKTLKVLEELRGKKDGLTGVPTGFTALDRLTSGWQSSDLIIMAARPGMGKTSLVMALARNAAMDFGKGVAIFSLEMSNIQLVQRLISLEAEISGEKLRNGKLEDYEWQQLQSTIEKLSDAPIFIDDTPGMNIFELRAKCRRLKMQHDIQLVIIDYLQLMSGSSDSRGGNREQEVSAISRSLKGMAKELGVPVIALSQLSRAVEVRGGAKRPQLSDLRESGSIEQDADMVAFIYRPEYYQILEDEDGSSLKGVAEIIFAKNRHGSTDTIKLRWVGEYAKFTDLDDPDFGLLGNGTFTPDPFAGGGGMITRPSKINSDTGPEQDDDIPF